MTLARDALGSSSLSKNTGCVCTLLNCFGGWGGLLVRYHVSRRKKERDNTHHQALQLMTILLDSADRSHSIEYTIVTIIII